MFWTLSFASAGLLEAQNGPTENRSEVVAEINGSTVTLGELEQQRADSLFSARRQYYAAQKKALEGLIEERLLALQAHKENVTVEQLLERHVTSQVKAPTDQELKMLYDSMQADQPFEAVRDQMFARVREMRVSKARSAYLKTLWDEAKISLTLPEPRVAIALEGKTLRGPETAPVRLVEFADYQCPYCRQLEPQLERLKSEFGDKITVAFKDFPLPMHAHAQQLAEAADCAGAQGKFWDYHDFLFKDLKDPFEVAVLKEKAKALNLDSAKFNSCFDSNAEAAEIKKDSDEAMRLGITGTPTMFINGRYVTGNAKYETLRAMVAEELAATSSRTRETANR